MRKQQNFNDMSTWTKKQLIAHAKSMEARAEQYSETIKVRGTEFRALLAEARRRTIPYYPQSGHCSLDRIEPGLTVNILPKRVVSMSVDKRRPSSSIMNARFLIEVEGEVVVNIEGKTLSPILAEIEIQKRIDAKSQDASLEFVDASLLSALDGVKA
jgi:hypothetical protein